MNELISRLKKIHEEWLKSSQLAMAATQDEQKAKCIAADKFSVQLMEMIPEIVQRMTSLERQIDFLAENLECVCEWHKDYGSCPVDHTCPKESLCLSGIEENKEAWIQAAKDAANAR